MLPSATNSDTIRHLFHSLFNSYSDIFFMRGMLSGAVILCITLLNYNAGVSGMLSILAAYSVARLLGYETTFLSSGFFTYNALLVGLAIGYMFEISWLSLLMILIAGSLTLIITIVTAQIFHQLFGLQILSVPFILVSTLVYLSAASFTNLYVAGLYSPMLSLDLGIFPWWLSGYLKSLGAIIFMPNEITGLLLALLLLLNSRILFLLSLSGFLLGITLYGLFTGSVQAAALDVSGFNYILIAMAVGGIFNIPSLKSYSLAFLGVAFATLIASAGHVFWSQYGLPIFTLPFTIVTLSFIYALNLLQYPLRTQVFKGAPEDNLEHYLSTRERFVTEAAAISLPFAGRWFCWQGFDGEWTHKGLYRYAYDFVIRDADHKTYMNDGSKLDDYFCYGQQVLSPVHGRVARVVHLLPDNPVGSVDTVNNWGNEIVIEDWRGYIVRLAHFAHQSIFVVEGQWVEVGTVLGLCGNSGNSPQPHIHIQLQADYTPAAATVPFVFVNYEQDGCFHRSGLPAVHQDVSHCQFDLYYDQVSNFVLDEQFRYEIVEQGRVVDSLELVVRMSDYAGYYLEAGDEKGSKTGTGRLYFGKQYGNFYFYSVEGDHPRLKQLFLALSSLPLCFGKDLCWQDNIDNRLLLNPLQAALAGLLNSIRPDWVSSRAEYRFIDETTVAGCIENRFFGIRLQTRISLDPVVRFGEIQVGDTVFKLQSHQHAVAAVPASTGQAGQ